MYSLLCRQRSRLRGRLGMCFPPSFTPAFLFPAILRWCAPSTSLTGGRRTLRSLCSSRASHVLEKNAALSLARPTSAVLVAVPADSPRTCLRPSLSSPPHPTGGQLCAPLVSRRHRRPRSCSWALNTELTPSTTPVTRPSTWPPRQGLITAPRQPANSRPPPQHTRSATLSVLPCARPQPRISSTLSAFPLDLPPAASSPPPVPITPDAPLLPLCRPEDIHLMGEGWSADPTTQIVPRKDQI